jgi:hypothetical protein
MPRWALGVLRNSKSMQSDTGDEEPISGWRFPSKRSPPGNPARPSPALGLMRHVVRATGRFDARRLSPPPFSRV